MRKHYAVFANFNCRFGDRKELLDLAVEVVIPAFTNENLVRNYRDTASYRFHNVELIPIKEDGGQTVFVIAGQFIKNKKLTRHQTFDERKGLIADEQFMMSAPSAFFVLILNNHRLIYLPETPYAPDLKEFESTALYFFSVSYGNFIDNEYIRRREDKKPITKKSLREENPKPTLKIVYLTARIEIAEFLRRYKTLKKIDFHVIKPNEDLDAGEIINGIRRVLFDDLKSDKAKLTASNTKGLDIGASIEVVTVATASGNHEVNVSGTDADGNSLSGNNEKFMLSSKIDNIPTDKRELVRRLITLFSGLISQRKVDAPRIDQNSKRITSVIHRLR